MTLLRISVFFPCGPSPPLSCGGLCVAMATVPAQGVHPDGHIQQLLRSCAWGASTHDACMAPSCKDLCCMLEGCGCHLRQTNMLSSDHSCATMAGWHLQLPCSVWPGSTEGHVHLSSCFAFGHGALACAVMWWLQCWARSSHLYICLCLCVPWALSVYCIGRSL